MGPANTQGDAMDRHLGRTTRRAAEAMAPSTGLRCTGAGTRA
jgi:hypothetical protein